MPEPALDMPPRDRVKLVERVHAQIQHEVDGDVQALYELIDPAIRQRREQRDDEPELTLSSLSAWCDFVTTATILSLEVTDYLQESPGRGNRPVAKVQLRMDYNDPPQRGAFSTIWVRDKGAWYTTALNKMPKIG